MDRREFISLLPLVTQYPRPLPMEDEYPDPNIPHERDPFDLTLCNQLPQVITAEEDRILRHILRITCSDYQMRDRAYDSIVCMWKKKIFDMAPPAGAIPPDIFGVSPGFGYGVDDITITITARAGSIDALTKVYFKGLQVTPVTFNSSGEFWHTLTCKINLADMPRIGGIYPVMVVNQYNLMANSTFVVNQHQPRLDSVSPSEVPSQTRALFTLTGDYFADDAYPYKNGSILNTAGDIVSRSRTQIQVYAYVSKFIMGGSPDYFSVGVPNLALMSDRKAVYPGITDDEQVPLWPTLNPSTSALTSVPLTVTGTGYVNGSSIYLAGAPQSTTYVSPTTLTCTLDFTNKAPGNYPIAVMNPNGMMSASSQFVKTPAITSLNPASVPSGVDTLVTVNGTGFVSGCYIYFRGAAVNPTTFLSSTSVRGTFPMTGVPGNSKQSVYVRNPDGSITNVVLLDAYVG